jgi:uncharacterized protein YecE (DUF72 family)
MLYIGTCSWKYDSWKGIIYPDKEKFDYLVEYSKHYNTVEVDQWFWSLFEGNKILLPKDSDVKSYTKAVPDDFKFSIKIPNSITLTHFYNRSKKELLKENPHFFNPDLFAKILTILKPMKKKLGPLMFQFEYLNKQKMSGLPEFIDRFEAFLEQKKSKYLYGIEIRNPNYLKKPFFEFIQRNNLIAVLLEGYYMPPVKEVFKEFKDYIEDTVVIRLHGPDRSGIEKATGKVWNKIVAPKDEQLNGISEIAHYFLNKKMDVYLNVNNHYEGSAPLTIQKIEKLIPGM